MITVFYKICGLTFRRTFKPGDYAGALTHARRLLRRRPTRTVTIEIF